MITAMESVTRDLAMMSLDVYALRNRVTAMNIANHATEGFAPLRVDFESHLGDLRTAVARRLPTDVIRSELAQLPELQSTVVEQNEKPGLDALMGDLMRNTLEYEALLSALARLGAISRSVVDGGVR